MALTYKIQDDGTPQPMGDTQGILIPKQVIGLQLTIRQNVDVDQQVDQEYPLGLGEVSYGDPSLRIGDRFVAPVDGWYSITFSTQKAISVSSGLYFGFFVYRNGSVYRQFGAGSNDDWYIQYPNGVYYLKKDDQVSYRFWANNPFTVLQYTTATFVLISKEVSDIIANKGALVSGKSFQFDADGNGFTSNYPPVGTEWRVGTWSDGKPIYMQTLSSTLDEEGVVIGNVIGLTNGSVKSFDLNVLSANMDYIVDHYMYIQIVGVCDVNPLGYKSTASGDIDINCKVSLVRRRLDIKNIAGYTLGSQAYIHLRGWLTYTKTTD